MTKFDDMLNILASREAKYQKKELENYFINNYSSELQKEILKIKNPSIYSSITSIMQYKIDISEIDEKRNKIIQDIILNKVDLEKEIFTFFTNYNSIPFMEVEKEKIESAIKSNEVDKVLKEISKDWLTKYIIYYFFHDSFYNYLVNLNQMLRYLRNIKIDLINQEHLSFYLECYNLTKMSFADKINFFKNNYLRKDITAIFYDDISIIKQHSYQNLVNSLLNIRQANDLKNTKLTNKYQYPIYYLNGEKFNALIRHISFNNGRSKEEYQKYVNSQKEKDYYSFSYISDKNISIIGNTSGFTLLYGNINPNYITHVYHDDAGSSYLLKEKHFITNKYNEIHTPESLIMDTKYYNEIVIKKGQNGIEPSALVCFDEVKKEELQFAKEYHLPIVLINSKKYYQSTGYTDFDDYDTYSL